MTPSQNSEKALTKAQRDLLWRIVQAEYGEMYLRGADWRAAHHPRMKPLIDVIERWAKITDDGRKALAT